MRVLNSLSDINVSRILRLIWLEKKISRVEIASRLGMDKSTVTKITSELQTKGFIREAEAGESGPQGGRKPVFIELNAEFACAGGIEINPEKFYCCLLNLNREKIFEFSEEINIEEYEACGLMGYFEKAVLILKKQAKALKLKLAGIGAGFPALIDVENGRIIQSLPLLIYEPIDFIKQAQNFAQLPVFFDNDARCCCYTERMMWGNVAEQKNMMYVLVRYREQKPAKDSHKYISVGFGFVLNGKIYHGAHSTAGEFRSILWKPTSHDQFMNGNAAGTKLTDRDAVTSVFKELAQNVAFLVNTLNLDEVYVGGIEKEYSAEIVKYIRENISYLWPYDSNETSTVTPGTMSAMVVADGAGILVLDNLFSVPEFTDKKNTDDSFYNGMSALKWLENL